VYELPRGGAAPGEVQLPDPLNASPLDTTTFTLEGVTFGVERCFAVRAVDVIGGVVVRGPASPAACAEIADTFAPAPPRDLVAIAVPGAISLIWEPSDSPDVAGYLVLRAEAGDDTLAPVTSSPIAGLSYRDDTTTAGVRYVYTVVAVDRAGNRSAGSNRVEETAQ
jgi:chitin-binding protein